MSGPDFRMQQEIEEERMMVELAIVQRISRGIATESDARYVAASFGLTTEFNKEQQHEMAK